MQALIKIAAQELGISEVSGAASNPRILQYAKEVGFDNWYHDDDTPWCSLFMNWVAMKAGAERSKHGRAASWGEVGKATQRPEPGDIALFAPRAGARNVTHVGIYMGYSQDKSRIYVLGGNQSDAVNISAFKADKHVEFRRLAPASGATSALPGSKLSSTSGSSPQAPVSPTARQVVLQRGDQGPQVMALQDSLKLAGFDCGTSDGIFGRMTEQAIRQLQETDRSLSVTGVYDAPTHKRLRELL